MIKIDKRVWLVLGVILFVVAAVFLYLRYSGQVSQQAKLQSSLATAQGTLTRFVTEGQALAKQKAELESQLAQARLSLTQTEASFPKSVESIEYDELLFSLAEKSNLAIVSLTASAPAPQKEGDITYSLSSFTVMLEAKLPETMFLTAAEHKAYIYQTVANILDFVNKIAFGQDFAAASVNVVSMSVPEALSEAEIDLMTKAIRRELLGEATGPLSPAAKLWLSQQTSGLSALPTDQLTEAEIDIVIQKALVVAPDLLIRGTAVDTAIWNRLADKMAKLPKPSATIEISIYSLAR